MLLNTGFPARSTCDREMRTGASSFLVFSIDNTRICFEQRFSASCLKTLLRHVVYLVGGCFEENSAVAGSSRLDMRHVESSTVTFLRTHSWKRTDSEKKLEAA